MSDQRRLKVVFGVAPYLVSVFLFSIAAGVCRENDAKSPAGKSAEALAWPCLSEFHCIRGRAANREDINKGNALFVMEQDGVSIGHAFTLIVPQYAYYLKEPKGGKTPCVIAKNEKQLGDGVLSDY